MAEKILKGYKIQSLLGKGGMAAIYLAENIATKESVALKVLLPHIASDRDYVLRFLHEVRANKRLDHKNIVRIIDCDEVKGNYFMAMEYINGLTLQELLRKTGKIPLRCALFILREILEGLVFSHSRNIIHRDMKPSNILISKFGEVKITDFGISKTTEFTNLTQTGSILGTPAYMSPEQARGKPVDNRSDLFSTGVMFYEMLFGINPFFSDNPSTAILNILQKTPAVPSDLDPTLSPDVEAMIERMMSRDPEHRFPSAMEICEEIQRFEISEGALVDQSQFREFVADPVKKSDELNRSDALLHFDLARGLEARGPEMFNQAIWEYHKVLYFDPANGMAAENLARLCSTLGYQLEIKKSNRIIELEEALERDPNNVPILMQLAKLHRLGGNFFEVLKYYKKLKKLKPNDTYLQGQIDGLLGDKTLARQISSAYWSSPESPTASQYVSSSPQTLPRIDLVHVNAAPRQSRSGFMTMAIFSLFIIAGAVIWMFFHRAAVSDSEDSRNRIRVQSVLDLDTYDPDLMGEQTAPISPEAAKKLDLAEKSFQKKDYRKAHKLFEKFKEDYPDIRQVHVLFRLAECSKNIGDLAEALRYYNNVIDNQPQSAQTVIAQKERAGIYSLQKNYYDAQMEYETVISRLDLISEMEFRVNCIMDFALFLKTQREYDRALEMTARIIDEISGIEFHNRARELRSQIFLAMNRPKDALNELYALIDKLTPESPDFQEVSASIRSLEKRLGVQPRSSGGRSDLLGEEVHIPSY